MASTGDPSTFTFTMDAMPGYTYFDKKKKVLCVMQIIDEVAKADPDTSWVMDEDDYHEDMEELAETTLKDTAVDADASDVANGYLVWAPVEGAKYYTVAITKGGKTTTYKTYSNAYEVGAVDAEAGDTVVVTAYAPEV